MPINKTMSNKRPKKRIIILIISKAFGIREGVGEFKSFRFWKVKVRNGKAFSKICLSWEWRAIVNNQ